MYKGYDFESSNLTFESLFFDEGKLMSVESPMKLNLKLKYIYVYIFLSIKMFGFINLFFNSP